MAVRVLKLLSAGVTPRHKRSTLSVHVFAVTVVLVCPQPTMLARIGLKYPKPPADQQSKGSVPNDGNGRQTDLEFGANDANSER